jgi:hypothetical protein
LICTEHIFVNLRSPCGSWLASDGAAHPALMSPDSPQSLASQLPQFYQAAVRIRAALTTVAYSPPPQARMQDAFLLVDDDQRSVALKLHSDLSPDRSRDSFRSSTSALSHKQLSRL